MRDADENGDFTVKNCVVIDVGPDYAVVRIEEKREEEYPGCRSCSAKSLCRGCGAGYFDMRAPLPGGMSLRKGDAARVAYRRANAAAAAFVMFFLPLLGLAAGGLAGYWLGGGGDAACVIGCVAGFAAGEGGSIAASRFTRALKPVVRVLPKE